MAMTPPQTSLVFAIYGPIERTDLPGLCARVCQLFGGAQPGIAYCDVQSVPADAVTVDALARLQLAARAYALQVRLRNASPPLIDLIAFLGLDAVLPD